ncbi:ABC transporter permease [Asanoa siamensis]|uniref:ABC transporter n=1 Tax=Asanoa siamensis TaxID=926357 RepID=A0ABQ4CJ25_9ACTN|nr:ABC transporter permease [Asanoa siamensis]GIF71305.1 ABC transporter [Asanoa siamensis]
MTVAYDVASGAARRRRVAGIVRRDVYALHRNGGRLLDIFFWPVLELVIWGFVTAFLRANNVPIAVSMLLGAVLLWHAVARAQAELAMVFMQDVWSRNLLNVFAGPISLGEFLAGHVIFVAGLVTASTAVLSTLALLLYGIGVTTIGPAAVPFLVVLTGMGWGLGIIAIGIVIRFGEGTQSVAWVLAAAFQPFAAVFYPVAVLPPVAQAIAWAVPASHVFEGLRGLLAGHGIDWAGLATAAALDVALLAGAVAFLAHALRHARRTGRLSKFGE